MTCDEYVKQEQERRYKRAEVLFLKEKGYPASIIAKETGLCESAVRSICNK